MSKQKTRIHFKVAKDGNVQILDVTGVGSGCLQLTSGIEAALGVVDEKSRETTSSMYQDVDPLKLTAGLD